MTGRANQTSQSSGRLILRASDFCPFCHSCRLVLAEKGIPYKLELLDLDKKADFPERLSPYGRVPVLVDGARSIFESSLINEYLDEVYPDVSLLLGDAADRAQVRFWVDFTQTRIVSAYFALMNEGNANEWPKLRKALGDWLSFLETKAFTGRYICGDRPSLADFSLYPWFERMVSASRYRGFSMPDELWSLRNWLSSMGESQTVTGCAKSKQDYITYFDRYREPL